MQNQKDQSGIKKFRLSYLLAFRVIWATTGQKYSLRKYFLERIKLWSRTYAVFLKIVQLREQTWDLLVFVYFSILKQRLRPLSYCAPPFIIPLVCQFIFSLCRFLKPGCFFKWGCRSRVWLGTKNWQQTGQCAEIKRFRCSCCCLWCCCSGVNILKVLDL